MVFILTILILLSATLNLVSKNFNFPLTKGKYIKKVAQNLS